MRKVLIALVICCLSTVFCRAQTSTVLTAEAGFKQVPDSIRIGCYWYWLSDNISKEGVIKDLQAMKKAGITRAYIGNIGLGEPYGKVKFESPEWWDILHTALKTATKLNIEIGIFNSPGWSQSGGPWIKPNQSMRYLASTDTLVNGAQQLIWNIPNFSDSAQLVKIIAFPARKNFYQKEYQLKDFGTQSDTLNMPVDENQTIRSFSLKTENYIRTNAELQAKIEGRYKIIRKFEIDRTNYQKIVGFIPDAPVVLSLPATEATAFRLVLAETNDSHGKAKATVTLSSRQIVERYPEQSFAKMFQRPHPMWGTYMWQRQDWYDEKSADIISPDKVLDITSSLSPAGKLQWNVPAGDWTIAVLEMKPTGTTNSPATPEATGLEVDKMSKKHVASHFDAYLGEILRRIPAADRKSFKITVEDSYETGGQNWTDDMLEVFQKTYGYNPLPYLPVLQGKVVGNEDISSRFLWDLRRLVADRVAYDYVGGLRDVSHQHGLTTWLENYGHWGFPGEFLQYGGQSDEVAGEFWLAGDLGDIENRAASSCAHIYGKQRTWAESVTSGGSNYTHYPSEFKPRIDRFFTEGINATLFHVYIHQPYEDKNPGVSAWFGNDFQRKNTWFSQMDVFTDYIHRANWMLQQGKYIADVAYFIGEDAPKMTGVEDPMLPKGYSFDYINAEVLLQRATVKDGYLVLPGGMRYRLLVLPNQQSMRPELLKKICQLVNDGLAVYGEPPTYSPGLTNYPEADNEVKSLGQKLFAANTFGKGKVFHRTTNLQQALNDLGIEPDFTTSQDSVLFIHRKLNDGDIYFISNQTNRKIDFDGVFRVDAGLSPELWNALTGEIRSLPNFKRAGNRTLLPLELDKYGSAFIVFRKGHKSDNDKTNFNTKQLVYTINTPWLVSFEKGKRGPANAVTFNTLTDWKDAANDSIKYFSGSAVYTTTFTLHNLSKQELYIDLGKVMVMAKVKLNGQYVGGVWTAPYRLNITKFLKAGENKLEITVVNNWRNRLIGDQKLPEKERRTWTTVNPWKADSPLQSSGLLGPVEIRAYDYTIEK
ncbi:glycoside hydrolase family 2 [Arachidicoccus ginsenosidimutans]|uniref:glycosyl hydrolase n=1 Tax=Arachidicoccus sp. BS20 TaxID=1850526 RepID=UPI0007F17878|nr:glycosyl hydrolase [Arachidicoccus sp. BS20]ANI89646.1 glycoside hydrolase family 2 [Arachidicoccus sp. BS20]